MTDTAEKTIPMYEIAQVQRDRVEGAFALLGDLIEKACAYSGGRFTPQTVFEACTGQRDGMDWQLWVVFDPTALPNEFSEKTLAVAVTCLSEYPTGLRVGEIILIGGRGNSEQWLHHIGALKEWAVAENCHRLQFIGRRGWQRLLGDECRLSATMYEVDLTEEENGHGQRH